MSLPNMLQSFRDGASNFYKKMRKNAAPLAFAATAAALPLTADAAVRKFEQELSPGGVQQLQDKFASHGMNVAILYVGELSSLGQYALDGTVGLIEKEHPEANIAVIKGNPLEGIIELHIIGQDVITHTEHTVGRAFLHEDIEEGLGLTR